MILERLRKRRYYRKYLKPFEHVSSDITLEGGTFTVSFGNKSFFVKTSESQIAEPEVFDFAIYGLAALSMSKNIEITLNAPVSEDAARQLERLRRSYDTWTIIHLAPLRVNLANVVPDPKKTKTGKRAICASGGIDSTAAAIVAKNEHEFTHGILIAGADYVSAQSPGFIELEKTVREQTKLLGLDLLVTETNIKTHNLQWEMLFGVNLAMCLHAHSSILDQGAIGADFTEIQDLTMFPWGTSHAQADIFSTNTFEVLSLNRFAGRTEKLRSILEHDPALVNHMSFCWKDQTQGGNCGKCLKCQRTKLNFMAAVGSVPEIFVDNPPLVDFVNSLQTPKRFSGVRTKLMQIWNIWQNLDEGDLKTALSRHYFELKEAYAVGMPTP